MIGKIHSIIFCMRSVCLFIDAGAVLRRIVFHCMYHRHAHIANTKIAMTTLPLVPAVVKVSETFVPKKVVSENSCAVATSKAPSGSRLPRAMYGIAEST